MGTRDEAVARLKAAALLAGKRSIALALAGVPIANWLVINQLIMLFVSKVLEYAIDKGELGIFFLFIDIRGSIEGQEFEKAMMANQIAQQSGTEKEKEDAENNVVIALRKLKYTA